MKITIRVKNANPRRQPRPAPAEKASPSVPPHPKKVKSADAVIEATSIAVAKELKRLRSVTDAAAVAAKQAASAAPPPPSPAPRPGPLPRPSPATSTPAAGPSSAPPASGAVETPSFADFGLEAEPGLSAIQTRFKILIVDDDPIIVRLLTHFLSQSNYEVKSVNDGMEGLKIAFAEKPDLILLDVMMPGMNGFRFLELLKKGKRFANVPVLMISAIVEEDQVLRALEAGATDYIVKPFSSRIVLAKVHKALKDLL